MRVSFIAVVMLVAALSICVPANAQSGSTGGAFSGGGGGFGGAPRPSTAEKKRQALERLQQQQQLALARARAQAANAKQQYQQSLVQLGLKRNTSVNATQNRFAFAEAQKDYRALRQGNTPPQTIGALNSPFRLTRKDISRATRMANWPEALRRGQNGEVVNQLDASIRGNTIATKEDAQKFLDGLQALNQSLNSAAAAGQINIKDYAKARRFVTGLAHEVRVSGLVM